MQQVISADGTEIALEREGSGHPLVLVHGGSGTRRVWDAIRPHLVEDFALVVPDRRGRGASGDADAYSLGREVADLRALLGEIDGQATVFGHSFGGLVALAGAKSLDISGLVLYEPAVLVGDHRGGDLAARMQARLDEGRREDAMALFYREAGGVTEPRELPFWPEEVNFDLVETVIRENRAVEGYELAESPAVQVPTLLLSGENGPGHLRDGVFALAERLSESQLVELEGVGHVGVDTAPGRVADAVRTFVCGQDTGE